MPSALREPWMRLLIRRTRRRTWLWVIAAAIMLSPIVRTGWQFDFVGVLLIGFGLMAAAVDISDTHSSGLLDQIRLGGRSPRTLLMDLLLVNAAPWVVLGVITLVAASLAGGNTRPSAETIIVIGLIAGGTLALMQIGLGRRSFDVPHVVAGVLIFAIAFLFNSLKRPAWVSEMQVMLPLILIEWACVAIIARPIVGQIMYPPAVVRQWNTSARLPLRTWMLPWPAFFRTISVALNGVVIIVIFAPMIMIPWWFDAKSLPTAAFVVTPLAIGMILISLVTREDAVSGRFDMVRLATARPRRTPVEMTVGFWTPFVLCTVALTVLGWTFYGIEWSVAGLTMLGLMAAAPLPFIEGWSRQAPGSYLLSYLYASIFLMQSPWTLVALSALQWFALPKKFMTPDRRVLSGWQAIAVASLAAAACMIVRSRPGSPVLSVTATLMAISPLLLDPLTARREIGCGAIAIAVIAAVAAQINHDLWTGVSLALSAAVVWLAAARIIALLPERPVGQSGLRLIGVSALMGVSVFADRYGYGELLGHGTVLAQGIGVGLFTEAMARLVARIPQHVFASASART